MTNTNTSKPTAGHWEAGTQIILRSIRIYSVDYVLAEVTVLPGHEDEARANARLIAAAPALVEALEKSALALSEAAVLLTSKGLGGCGSIMEGHAGIARAALAKVQP